MIYNNTIPIHYAYYIGTIYVLFYFMTCFLIRTHRTSMYNILVFVRNHVFIPANFVISL